MGVVEGAGFMIDVHGLLSKGIDEFVLHAQRGFVIGGREVDSLLARHLELLLGTIHRLFIFRRLLHWIGFYFEVGFIILLQVGKSEDVL